LPFRSYAVADTGEVWAWGRDGAAALGHGEQTNCPLPTPIASLRGVKVVAVAAGMFHHTLALADDGSVYAWGNAHAAPSGALGLGAAVREAERGVHTPRRMPGLGPVRQG
jgi:alpha-tubulin suppressor-like RCC1 family protein